MNRISLAVQRCVFALAVMLLGWLPGAARAQTLYGITVGGGDQLITINPITAAGTPVGLLSSPMFAFGIAFQGNKLYTFDQGAARIRELNVATGATVNTINIGAVGSGEGDIAFRSDGIGFLSNINTPNLTRFDLAVPNNTVVGPLAKKIDGLAFNGTDVLYGIEQFGGNLYTIDQTTGVLTLVGPTGINKVWVDALGGLAFDASGNLFMSLAPWPAGPTELYQIDPTTGLATLVGNVGINSVSGIRFGPAPNVTITQSAGTTNVTEGGATDSYTVVLNTAPTANVTITINPGPQVTVVPATLTFTPAN